MAEMLPSQDDGRARTAEPNWVPFVPFVQVAQPVPKHFVFPVWQRNFLARLILFVAEPFLG